MSATPEKLASTAAAAVSPTTPSLDSTGNAAASRPRVAWSIKCASRKANRAKRRQLWRFWVSQFLRKHPRIQDVLLSNPHLYPVVTLHLAAMRIQRWFRGERVRKELRSLARGSSGKEAKTNKVAAATSKAAATADTGAKARVDLHSQFYNQTGQVHVPSAHAQLPDEKSAFKHWAARYLLCCAVSADRKSVV